MGGGHGRNRTGVHGFAVRCVTTPPRGHFFKAKARDIAKVRRRYNRFGMSLEEGRQIEVLRGQLRRAIVSTQIALYNAATDSA